MYQSSFHPSAKLALRLVALASAICCVGTANAQASGSGVTLYGIADVGVTQVTGLKAGTVTQVSSGIMDGSRWGIRGNEDMGGGYRTIFTLESRVELTNGSQTNRPVSGSQLSDRYSQAGLLGLPSALQPAVNAVDSLIAQGYGVNVAGSLFDRQAYVGVVTPVGAFLAGRMYTPGYEASAAYDIMETQSGLAAGQLVAVTSILEIRRSSSLAYRFEKDGLSGSLMYSEGAPGDAPTDQKRLWGARGNYASGDFSMGFGYNTANNENGATTLTTASLGASMKFGADKLSGMVIKIVDDNPSGFSAIKTALTPTLGAGTAGLVQSAFVNAFKLDGNLYHIGYRHTMGQNSLYVAYSTYQDNRASNNVRSYGTAYTYSLSKRTDLSAVLVRFDNDNLSQSAPGGTGYLGGVTSSAGTGATQIALGLRHRF